MSSDSNMSDDDSLSEKIKPVFKKNVTKIKKKRPLNDSSDSEVKPKKIIKKTNNNSIKKKKNETNSNKKQKTKKNSDINLLLHPDESKKYTKLQLSEQILKRPDTYIGSCDIENEEMWVFNDDLELMEKRQVTYPPGLYTRFLLIPQIINSVILK